jgi:HPr kinase/phosphorylase
VERPGAAELLQKLMSVVGLRLVTDGIESGADITRADTFRPGLLLAGFERGFAADRIQILGEPELAYLDSLEAGERAVALDRLCVSSVPCIVVAGGHPAPPELVRVGRERGIPVLASDAEPSRLAYDIASYLDELLAPGIAIHGTLVDVYGVGLLFTGKSGIGKSECALDLVASGHRLVADDLVHIVRTPQGHLVGSGSELIRHHMEIRGVGIIDVRAMFGIRAIRQRKRVEVEVKLTTWSDVEHYDRLGFDQETTEVLGVKIPVVVLPLVPGKNITVISEVIALNHLLKLGGVHTAREFDSRLKDLAARLAPADALERSDNE